MMKKRVNLMAGTPVTIGFGVPRVGSQRDILLTTDEIRSCLRAHARVEEILKSGRTIPLDFSNFDKNNEPGDDDVVLEQPVISVIDPVSGKKEEVIEEPKAEEEESDIHIPEGADPLDAVEETTEEEATEEPAEEAAPKKKRTTKKKA